MLTFATLDKFDLKIDMLGKRLLVLSSSVFHYTSILQGFNAALTEPVNALGRRGGQIREMELKLHPELKEPLKKLCDDPKTTVVVLSGSDRSVLDDVLYFLC